MRPTDTDDPDAVDQDAPARPVGRPVREPTPADWAALARLRSSHSWIDRVHALSDLLRGETKLAYAVFEPPFSDHAEVDDPDLRCFLVAQELAEHLGGRVPAVLQPFLERNDLDPTSLSRLESALAEHVEAWLGVPAAGRARTLRLELSLATSNETETAVHLAARVSSARLGDEARTGAQLRQLLNESRREPGLLTPDQQQLLEVVLEPILAVCLSEEDARHTLSASALLRLALSAAGSPHVSWSDQLDRELAERAGIEPGGPLRLGPDPVTIGPVLRDTSDGPRIVLEHRTADGRPLGPDDRLVLRGKARGHREPTLVLTDGLVCIAHGDPPAPLPELFEYAGGFDPGRAHSRTLLQSMARAFPELRDSLSDHALLHDVQLSVCLDLRDDDWLQLRAYAATESSWRPGDAVPADGAVFEWFPDGRWLPIGRELPDGVAAEDAAEDADADETADASTDTNDAPTADAADEPAADDDATGARPEDAELTRLQLPGAEPAADDDDTTAPRPAPEGEVWLELPDPERVDPLSRWLDALGAALASTPRGLRARPADDESAVGGWLLLQPTTIDAFARAWDERPSHVRWFANERARLLMETPEVLVPRVEVRSSGLAWFTVSAAWEEEGARLSEADLALLRRSSSRYVRLSSGWTQRAHVEQHDETAAALAELGLEIGAGEERVSVWQLAQARPEALRFLEGLPEADAALGKLEELRTRIAQFDGLPRVPVPDIIEGTLRPYQRDGLDVLVHASGLDLGVILADDMGLGKTLQALAWLAHLRAEDPDGGPALVVCPASVLHNWERECARFAPALRVLVLTAGEHRHAKREEIPDHDVVLTTYALMRRDVEPLSAVSWRAVVLDEAQNIKNPDAAVSRAARSLSAKHRLALTGTPLENRALDLWSIQAFLNPGYLGPRAAFVRRFDRPEAPPHRRTLLAAKLRPVLLRRLKSQVAPELPPRIEEQRDCELTPGQRKLYLAELARGRDQIDDAVANGGVARHTISVLAVLTRLRQICCHPALVGADPSLGSGKFDACFDVLETLRAEGHKVLVFSQFVECLKLLSAELDARGHSHHMLTGSSKDRGALVQAFEDDPEPSPFLISLKAGGTGLNLTAANYVIVFDPWWNPAVEAQAIDRTHRIGQDSTVIAYRMVARGTLEERIHELQARKAGLARDLLGEGGLAKGLTRDDLDFLLADVADDD